MAFTMYAKARRDPRVRHGIKEGLFRKRVLAEAAGTATWARRAPNAAVAGNLSVQINIPAAVTALFALS